MHEPLVIGLTLRFVSCAPWMLKNHRCLLDLGRGLRSVWQDVPCDERRLLRQLCLTPNELDSMLGGVAREVLHHTST
jgi:hypothetical protein